MDFVPLDFCPDLDTAWMVRPGGCYEMDFLAPLARGTYGTVGSATYVGNGVTTPAITSAPLLCKMFRSVSGAVRFISFGETTISEIASDGTVTSRGTGYNASTTGWQAAAFGDAVIAVNYLDVPQVCTGSGFGTLSGSPPKARLIAVNAEFVMLADYNDGTAYADGWWCSGIGNHQTWSASASTQAASGRILSEPGPIRALVAFKEGFVVFKDNAMFQMDYIGPPYIWSVKRISNRIGCPGPDAVTEMGGRLFWYHPSGFYAWDGANLQTVGDKVINDFNIYTDQVGTSSELSYESTDITLRGASKVQAVADDVENVVAFCATGQRGTGEGATIWQWTYALNTLTGKWGRWTIDSMGEGGDDSTFLYVKATTADVQSFKQAKNARLLYVATRNAYRFRYFGYPLAIDTTTAPAQPFTPRVYLGAVGDYGRSSRLSRLYVRDLESTQAGTYSVSVTSKNSESGATTTSSGSGVENAILTAYDLRAHGKIHNINLSLEHGKTAEIAGVALESIPEGRR